MKVLYYLALISVVLSASVALAEDSVNHTAPYPTAIEVVAHKSFTLGSLSQGATRHGGVGVIDRFGEVEGHGFSTTEAVFTRKSEPSWLGIRELDTEWSISASLGVAYNKLGAGLSGSASAERKSHKWIMATQWLLLQPVTEHSVNHGKTLLSTERLTIVAGEPAGELCYRFTKWACAGGQAGALRMHGQWSASPGPGMKFSLGEKAELSVGYGKILGLDHGPKHELLVVLRLKR